MSEFFPKGSEDKQFIPPDYSEVLKEEEIPFDSDLTGDDDDDDSDDVLESEEEAENEKIVEEIEENKMTTSPFGGTGTSTFGSSSSPSSRWGSGWGDNNRQSDNGFWNTPGSNNNSQGGWWGTGNNNNTWGSPKSNQESQRINREKRVIFIDFFDGLMETYQSQGQPGFLPRAVYDLKPRFEVWTKVTAFSPEIVFGIVQKEFLNDINGIDGWSKVLEGWCCCLSSFMRKQYGSAQILLSTSIYQPKEWVISKVLGSFRKEDCIYIGLQSGLYNQPNVDLVTAQKCGIDYVDLNQLLNNMC